MSYLITVFWIIVIIALIFAELQTLGLTTVWFVGGALFAAILSALMAPLWLQILVFVVVSLALMAVVRPIALKHFNPHRIRTNVDAMMGKTGIVMERIDNALNEGVVTVDGMEWSARSRFALKPIEKGTQVAVIAVEGNKLIVDALSPVADLTDKEDAPDAVGDVFPAPQSADLQGGMNADTGYGG